jgi:hypothetical protein
MSKGVGVVPVNAVGLEGFQSSIMLRPTNIDCPNITHDSHPTSKVKILFLALWKHAPCLVMWMYQLAQFWTTYIIGEGCI